MHKLILTLKRVVWLFQARNKKKVWFFTEKNKYLGLKIVGFTDFLITCQVLKNNSGNDIFKHPVDYTRTTFVRSRDADKQTVFLRVLTTFEDLSFLVVISNKIK